MLKFNSLSFNLVIQSLEQHPPHTHPLPIDQVEQTQPQLCLFVTFFFSFPFGHICRSGEGGGIHDSDMHITACFSVAVQNTSQMQQKGDPITTFQWQSCNAFLAYPAGGPGPALAYMTCLKTSTSCLVCIHFDTGESYSSWKRSRGLVLTKKTKRLYSVNSGNICEGHPITLSSMVKTVVHHVTVFVLVFLSFFWFQ